ncbi:MAG TPA: amino acid permease [Candidatus Eremiobacteraceae bacterium]|nr:amino acid permease [Candidatus Eremiobacteraceae bacterium]
MQRIWVLLKRLAACQPLDRIRPDHEGPKLRRVLGVWGLIGIGLGTMLGGIFPTVGVGIQLAGSGAISAFVVSGIVCIFVALCYAEFASMVPVAGSAYTYAYATLGEFIAWVIGWDLILEYGISAAPVASSFSGYLQELLGYFHVTLPASLQTAALVSTPWPVSIGSLHLGLAHFDLIHSQYDLIAALSVIVVSALLAIGIKESATTNAIFVILQILSFIVFIAVGLAFMHPSHFAGAAPLGYHSVIASAALVFFAYIGFDTVTVASEESKNPQRDVPIAVVGSLIIGALLFVAITAVTIGIVPLSKIVPDSAMSQAIRLAGNYAFPVVTVTLGAIVGNISVMLTSLLGQSRIFYVMSRDRMLPPAVSAVHPRFLTPARTTMITGIVVAFLALIVPLEDLLKLVNIGTLSAFAIVSIGVAILRFVAPNAKRPFKAPAGVVIGILGFLLCMYLILYGLSLPTWIRFLVWFAVGAAIYGFYGYHQSLLHPKNAQPKSD